jgi:RND superfamily putative drug exporter
MAGLARWCFTHRRRVVAAWLVAMVAVVAVLASAGSKFNASLSLPGTDSHAAQTLLTQNFPAASGEGDQVVIQTTHGATVRSPAVRGAVASALRRVSALPDIESVASPYDAGGAARISRSGTIAFATVTWDKQATDVTKTEAKQLIATAKTAASRNVEISLGGPSITNTERANLGPSVGVGIIAALIILLIVFGGALLASLMPLAAALLALGVAVPAIGVLSHALGISSVAPELSVLIGLGVGVDYGLFIMSRHRSAVKSGLSYEDAAAQAVATSGRTVLFAGITVCIALLGQLTLGVSFLNGLSVSAALAVALTMATSLTFLPAMLGFLGPKVLSRRERAAQTAGEASTNTNRFWLAWAHVVETRRLVVALGAIAALVVIALPILGLRLGSSDASTDPPGSTSRQAYTTLAAGFGAGFSGPLQLAGQVTTPADKTAFAKLLTSAAQTPGVTSVTPAVQSPNGKVLLASVYPTSGPQTTQTVNLVKRIRDTDVPTAEAGSSLVVHVGGVTASNIDFSHKLEDKLPLFIAVVVLLAFLLLVTVIRSLLIPLVASVMNLLSIGAALGALNAVFNWGWGGSIIGLSATGPIDAFLPVMMFSVLFGLSMDYEVFTIFRIQEEWHHRHHTDRERLANPASRAIRRNHESIAAGQANSAGVIAAAASIMILVFGSFLLGGHRPLQEFGFGLAFSVLVDALLIRSLAVPAIMHLIGPANWSLPSWLDRVLPRLSVDIDHAPVPAAGAGGEPLPVS